MASEKVSPAGIRTELTPFVERLVQEKGFDVDADVLIEIKHDLENRLEDHINAAILACMPAEQLEAFEKVIDHGDDAAMQSFCQTAIPELDQVVATALLKFRDTYLGL